MKISLLLCVFGFLKELRPSEPFIYEFLIGEWRNITSEQVNQEVYPVGTYSYLAQLVVVFLVTDLCRYKPLILILGASGIAVWGMLLWTTSLVSLQILEVRMHTCERWMKFDDYTSKIFEINRFWKLQWILKLIIEMIIHS